jgi:predicted membrane chloride channel (bestrophin family)
MSEDLPEEKQRELLENLANAAWAFPRSLQRHLLGEREDHEAFCYDIKQRLSPEVAQALIDAPHKPNRALFELTKAVNAIPLSEHRHVEIDRGVEHLCDTLGGCERIYSSPVPLVYTRHTARFLGFWILALPLALWNAFGTSWNHVGLFPAAMLISFFFFGIEELAIQLEEPFSILPLRQLVKNVEDSVDETVEWFLEEKKEQRKLAERSAPPPANELAQEEQEMDSTWWRRQ